MLHGIRGHKQLCFQFEILLRSQQFETYNKISNYVNYITDHRRIFAICFQPGMFDVGVPTTPNKN